MIQAALFRLDIGRLDDKPRICPSSLSIFSVLDGLFGGHGCCSHNYRGLAVITEFVTDFALAVASRTEDLTAVVDLEEPSRATVSRGRGAFLGIIPDFAYMGTGVGIKGTLPESPAEAAGLRDGDVILTIDGKPVAGLKGLMQVLVERSPGDEIEIRLVRAYSTLTVKATLSTRSENR